MPTSLAVAPPAHLSLRAAAKRLSALTGESVTVYTIWRLIADGALASHKKINEAGQELRLVTADSVEAYGAERAAVLAAAGALPVSETP